MSKKGTRMRIPYVLSLIVTIVTLAGCATAPPPSANLTLAPKEQIVSLPVVTSATPALVRVVRDQGFVGSAVFMHLSLDGKKFASLNPGEYLEFQADPGEYLFSVMLTDPFGLRQPFEHASSGSTNQRLSQRVMVISELPGVPVVEEDSE